MNFLELMEKWGNAEPADIQISSVPEVLGQRRLEQGSDGDGGGESCLRSQSPKTGEPRGQAQSQERAGGSPYRFCTASTSSQLSRASRPSFL